MFVATKKITIMMIIMIMIMMVIMIIFRANTGCGNNKEAIGFPA